MLVLKIAVFSAFVAVFLSVATANAQGDSQEATDVSVGNDTTCAIKNARAYCWGSNGDGRLGIGRWDIFSSKKPYPVATNTSKKSADSGNCIERSWIGTCSKYDRNPSPSIPASAMGEIDVTKISVGSTHVCAVADAQVYCWGDNRYGQLGNKSYRDSLVPVAVHVTDGSLLSQKEMIDVTAGFGFTCALASDYTVSCWGRNDHGQLGNGTLKKSNVPVSVSYDNRSDKLCTSKNFFGRCTATVNLKPSALVGKKVVSLARIHGDTATMCVLTEEGRAVCWGANHAGQVGNGARVPYGSDSGYGKNRHTKSHKCEETSEKAFKQAGVNLYSYRNNDSLRPADVRGDYTFKDLTITSNQQGDSVYVDVQKALVNRDSPGTVWIDGAFYTYVMATGQDGKTYHWGGKHVADIYWKCVSNGKAYYGDWTETELRIAYSITGVNRPTATNITSRLSSGNIKGLSCKVDSGNNAHCDARGTSNLTDGRTGSNYERTCRTETGVFGIKYTKCDPAPTGYQKVYTGGWLGGRTISAIDTSMNGTTCVVANDRIGCWGVNNRGQLGVDDTNDRGVPTAVRL